MAVLISCATGNFTDASTWALGNATSLLDSEAGNTALTTSYVDSSQFTPGAITIDGIAVKIASRAASPTGTISVELYNNTLSASVAGTEVVLNVSDIPTAAVASNEGGWILFKFSPVLLLDANAYSVRAKTSSGTQVNLYRDATAANWSRILRTTTTQAPAVGDVMHVIGEHTGAGTGNDFTVTMNNTATTNFGNGSTTLASLSVGKRGTLTWGTAVSTAYYLKLSGLLIVYNSGTLTIGGVGSAIPASSSAVIEFDCAVNVGFGLVVRNGVSFTAQGATKNVSTLLTADVAVLGTVLTVVSTSNWEVGDTLTIASTTRTDTQTERVTVLTVDSPTQVTLTTGVVYAHSGTSPTQAEVINLTRNIKIRGASSSLQAYVWFGNTAIVDIDYVEFYWLGSNAAGKRGIDATTTTGSCEVSYSALHDFVISGGFVISGAASSNITFSYNVGNINTSNAFFTVAATSGTWTCDHNIAMNCGYTGSGIYVLGDVGGIFTNNTGISGLGSTGVGISINEYATIGTFSGNTFHSNDYGILIVVCGGGTISNTTIWRNVALGIAVYGHVVNVTFDGITAFGNGTSHIGAYTNGFWSNVTITNAVFNAGVTLTCPIAILLNNGIWNLKIINCTFGVTTTHATADISVPATCYGASIILHNCALASPTEVGTQNLLPQNSFIASQKHDQLAGTHKTWLLGGTISLDNITYKTAAPSEKLYLPGGNGGKLETARKSILVLNVGTATVSVWVYKDASYAGSQPRLIQKANVAAGVANDVVLDTMVVAIETWEQLSGVTTAPTDNAVVECIIDVDGSTGAVYVDDWAAV